MQYSLPSAAAPFGYLTIEYSDLEFKRVPVIISSQGNKYLKEIDVGMPKIPESILDCVFYLYANESDAKKGIRAGGTGFLVGVPSKISPSDYTFIYGVTNWHVAVKKKLSVIRLNTVDGRTRTFNFEPKDWVFIPHKDDVAISPLLRNLHGDKEKVGLIHVDYLAKDQDISECQIGIGDDVFLLGRFINHDGGVTNQPVARFGHISAMPTLIPQLTRYTGHSYLIDMNCRTGFSGSPVLVYRTYTGNFEETYLTKKPFASKYGFLYLLGIHWGQFPEELEVTYDKNLAKSCQVILPKGGWVLGWTGMTCVIPAARILDLLNSERFQQERDKEDLKLYKYLHQNSFPARGE
jgi:hypothetical protein